MTKETTSDINTRAALLECADKLFIAHGYSAVSIRNITMASGTNVAAVNYHFQDKKKLFREVLTKRLDIITGDKLALLSALEKQHPPATLEKLLRAYIRSFFDSHLLSTDNDRLMQMIYREMGPDAVAGDLVATRLIIPINKAFKAAIQKVALDIDEKHASFCVSSITGQILHFVRSREIIRSIHNQEQNQAFVEEVIEHITQFSLRGLGSKHHA